MIAVGQNLSSHSTDCGEQPLASLLSSAMFRRAGAVALILGSVLTLANQPNALLGGDRLQVLPLVTAYATPFVVAAVSQVLGVRQAHRHLCQCQPVINAQHTILRTALSHGIPLRALLLALIIGTANTVVLVCAVLAAGGEFSTVPPLHIAQGFFLPMLFGLMSQAVSYRRVTGDSTPLPNQQRKSR